MTYAAERYQPERHRDALLRIWRESMSDASIGARLEERYRWFYEGCPAGPAATWVSSVVETGEVVGCASLFPRRVQLAAGEDAVAGVLCDFAVLKAHRIGGAAILVQRRLAEEARAAGFRFLFGYPNQHSLAVCKRVGYEVVGETRTFVRPLRTAYRLGEVLAARAPKLPEPERVARAAAPLVDLGLRALDVARLAPSFALHRAEVLSRADDRFDALWRRARHRHDVIGEKTRAWLDWRYADFTTTPYRLFALSDRRSGELRGYVVFSLDGEAAHVADVFAEDREGALDATLLRFVDAMRGERVRAVRVTFCGPDAFAARLRRLLFVERPGGRKLVLHLPKGAEEPHAARLRDPGRWLMLDGELDI